MKRTIALMLFGVILVSVLIRVFFSYQTPYLSYDESYSFLLSLDSFIENPSILDQRDHLYQYLTVALFGIFSLVFSYEFMFKFIGPLVSASTILLVYAITFQITKNQVSSVVAGLSSAFIPIFYLHFTNRASSLILAVPFFLLMIYVLFSIDSKTAVYYVPLLLVFPFVTPLSLLFLFSLAIYFILLQLEGKKPSKVSFEAILFSVFFLMWAALLMFKNAFLLHGPQVIWQNIPSVILDSYFSKTTLIEAIYNIGILPFFWGSYAVYRFFLGEKTRYHNTLFSILIALILLLWLKLIELHLGILLVGLILSIFSGMHYTYYVTLIRNSKFYKHLNAVHVFIFISFFMTSIIPSISFAQESVSHAPDIEQVESLERLSHLTADGAVLLFPLTEGSMSEYYTNRTSFLTRDYLYVNNVNQKVADIKTIYTTQSKIDALELLEKYQINYVIITPLVVDLYNITELSYVKEVQENPCFDRLRVSYIEAYEVLCGVN